MLNARLKAMAILATLCLTACGDGKQGAGGPAGGPPGGMPPPEVGIVILKTQSVDITESLPGRTSPYQSAEIRPQVGGIILKRMFEEGSLVQAGQQLYQIDPAIYQANFNTAQANVNKADALLNATRTTASRYKQLLEAEAISQQSYDDAFAALRSGEADVAAAKAALETARINLAYTKVMSPITGRIGKSEVTPGALVTAGQAQILTMVTQLDPIYVDVTQSSAQLLQLKQKIASGQLTQDGQSAAVDLYLDDIKAKYDQPGVLKFSDVTVDPTTGSVQLRALFPNSKGFLLPGLYVRAVIREGRHDNVLLVPQQAVTRDASGAASVLTVGEGDKVQKAEIKTGDASNDQWVALDGVKAGDRVIVQGIQKVQPGMPVKPVDINAPKMDAPPAGAVPADVTAQ